MGRASLLGLCLNSLHKANVWAHALGLRSGPVHILFSTPSLIIIISKCPLKHLKKCLNIWFKIIIYIELNKYIFLANLRGVITSPTYLNNKI